MQDNLTFITDSLAHKPDNEKYALKHLTISLEFLQSVINKLPPSDDAERVKYAMTMAMAEFDCVLDQMSVLNLDDGKSPF